MLRKLSFGLLVLLCACPSLGTEPPDATSTPTVPNSPRVIGALIERHARQFDEELAKRPAGSQEELAAATYIVGHLQLAGYRVTFDDVPVGNLVESSNVIALPPSGDPPRSVVWTAYDSSGEAPTGVALGVFLEVARALAFREPDHDVSFAAVGAYLSEDSGRGLVELERSLKDQKLAIDLIRIEMAPLNGPFVHLPGRGVIGDNAASQLLDYLTRHGD